MSHAVHSQLSRQFKNFHKKQDIGRGIRIQALARRVSKTLKFGDALAPYALTPSAADVKRLSSFILSDNCLVHNKSASSYRVGVKSGKSRSRGFLYAAFNRKEGFSRCQIHCTLFRKMAKGKRVLIRLMSAAGTGYFYVMRKNPKNVPHKLQFMKYDPVVNKHVLFTERKFKK